MYLFQQRHKSLNCLRSIAGISLLFKTMSKKINDIPKDERPREKLLRNGAAALEDHELLAVLLGRGVAGVDVMTLAAKLSRFIDEKGLGVRVEDLIGFDGMGNAKATLILAAIEFIRRRIKPEGIKIGVSADLMPHIRHYANRKQEHLLCASINGANEVINIRVVSIGLVDRSLAHPREVFADPITDRAFAVILAHNHPMGPLQPSTADIEVTRRLSKAGEIMGIAVLDHIIFNRTSYFSFLDGGIDF
uniref:DNA repair protein RadC n=1 Tax=Candidatus Kentrum eta TaxID=2126337 RepID=A0A450VS16_9GAMM|nr:MAG: DNA repair protein RadC [Candidatus Kentron sp. H]VFK04932.1 MAG: DNA repair protein RadC [Candidatus Kentron sp. H]VFK07572.1 MAG: DNA repair protein RadC [Candidatus Kentron sp. H]